MIWSQEVRTVFADVEDAAVNCLEQIPVCHKGPMLGGRGGAGVTPPVRDLLAFLFERLEQGLTALENFVQCCLCILQNSVVVGAGSVFFL